MHRKNKVKNITNRSILEPFLNLLPCIQSPVPEKPELKAFGVNLKKLKTFHFTGIKADERPKGPKGIKPKP